METGTVYFFTGLSGAGKTTVGGLFHKRLKARKPNVFWYDGDQMRPILFENVGYTMEERRRACQRGFGLCKAIADQGIDVVVCAIAMHSEARAWNRANMEKYKEIYLKVKKETLFQRDQKGMYALGAKNLIGVDLPFDEPQSPDFVIENDGGETPEEIVDKLWTALGLPSQGGE